MPIFISFNTVRSIEADIFVQSTVNRASDTLSGNKTKEERIEELNLEKAKKLDIPVNHIYESMKNQVPMKRIGRPEEFAYLASFLCSDKANYITGINIPIDGGLIKSL